jgi:hypothetical protein
VALMHFYDGESVMSDSSQSAEPDTCSSAGIVIPLEPAGVDARADVDAAGDSDDDTLMFDVDAQSRARRSASPPRSPPLSTSLLTSPHASPAATLSSLPNESKPSTSDMVLTNDKPYANARDIVCQPMCSSPLRLSSDTQPLLPLFQPADKERLWYLGFLTE